MLIALEFACWYIFFSSHNTNMRSLGSSILAITPQICHSKTRFRFIGLHNLWWRRDDSVQSCEPILGHAHRIYVWRTGEHCIFRIYRHGEIEWLISMLAQYALGLLPDSRIIPQSHRVKLKFYAYHQLPTHKRRSSTHRKSSTMSVCFLYTLYLVLRPIWL